MFKMPLGFSIFNTGSLARGIMQNKRLFGLKSKINKLIFLHDLKVVATESNNFMNFITFN